MSTPGLAGSLDQKIRACLTLYESPEKRAELEKNAALAKKICEQLLKTEGIKGVVSSRVKDSESLAKKLTDMSRDPGFRAWASEEEDLFKHHEMGDLVGLRFGMYLPNHVFQIATKCKEQFRVIHLFGTVGSGRNATQIEKSNLDHHLRGAFQSQDSWGSDQYWHHSGYKSWQMVVELADPRERQPRWFRVEIQVGTVVSQAWAEVQHNIIYKNPDGITSTPTMERMIDGINGLSITTEIMLSELERSIKNAQEEEIDRNREEKRLGRTLIKKTDQFFLWFQVTYMCRMSRDMLQRWDPHGPSVDRLMQFCTIPSVRLGREPDKEGYCGNEFKAIIEEEKLLQADPVSGDKCDIAVLLLEALWRRLGIEEEMRQAQEAHEYFEAAKREVRGSFAHKLF